MICTIEPMSAQIDHHLRADGLAERPRTGGVDLVGAPDGLLAGVPPHDTRDGPWGRPERAPGR